MSVLQQRVDSTKGKEMSVNQVMQHTKERMEKSVHALKGELSKLRTGRATPSLLEHIHVSYYGSDVPLSQVAAISVEGPRMLTVTPWEKPLVPVIEKAILTSDLGLNPATSGSTIRVPLPALTEERRKELARVVRDEAERARVSVRNVRREANQQCKDFIKDKLISEDEERRAETAIQKTTDQFIADIDKIAADKEAEIMTV